MARDHLTRGQIIAATIELLDSHGVEAFSIRRLGARLGAGATSIYWHVPSRDELLQLAGDEIFSEVDLVPAVDGDWRTPLEAYARSLRETMLRHPWMPAELASSPTYGPRIASVTVHLRTVCTQAGLDADQWAETTTLIHSYVHGFAGAEAAWATTVVKSGRTEEELMAEWMNTVRGRNEGALDAVPELEGAAAMGLDERRSRLEKSFEFGLQTILDGLAARLPEVGGRADV